MGLALAIICSLSFVALDILRKLLGRHLPAIQIVIGINMGAASVFMGVLIATGIKQWDITFIMVVAVELVAHIAASILYVQAVTLSPLSLTIPYLGFTPVVVTLLAYPLLGEVPSLLGLGGITLVVMGTIALNLGKSNRLSELLSLPFHEPGSWRMLVVAGIWGVMTPLDKIAIAHGSEALLAFSLSAGSALLLGAKCLCEIPKKTISTKKSGYIILLLMAAALVAGIAVMSQFFAYRELLVAYVETIKRAGSLVSITIGALAFNEKGLTQSLPATALIILGIILIIL